MQIFNLIRQPYQHTRGIFEFCCFQVGNSSNILSNSCLVGQVCREPPGPDSLDGRKGHWGLIRWCENRRLELLCSGKGRHLSVSRASPQVAAPHRSGQMWYNHKWGLQEVDWRNYSSKLHCSLFQLHVSARVMSIWPFWKSNNQSFLLISAWTRQVEGQCVFAVTVNGVTIHLQPIWNSYEEKLWLRRGRKTASITWETNVKCVNESGKGNLLGSLP